MGAVPVAVDRGLPRLVRRTGEVLRDLAPIGQVRVVRVGTGVQYGDPDAASVVPGPPRRRGADLRHAAVEGGAYLLVQPDLGGRAVTGQVGPDRGHRPLVRGDR